MRPCVAADALCRSARRRDAASTALGSPRTRRDTQASGRAQSLTASSGAELVAIALAGLAESSSAQAEKTLHQFRVSASPGSGGFWLEVNAEFRAACNHTS